MPVPAAPQDLLPPPCDRVLSPLAPPRRQTRTSNDHRPDPRRLGRPVLPSPRTPTSRPPPPFAFRPTLPQRWAQFSGQRPPTPFSARLKTRESAARPRPRPKAGAAESNRADPAWACHPLVVFALVLRRLLVLEAVRLERLPRTTRRLTRSERDALVEDGTVRPKGSCKALMHLESPISG